MHVATTRRTYQGKVYTTSLLRRSIREGKKVKHQTLGNLSHLPPDLIDIIRRRLAGEEPGGQGPWEIVRSLPHGHGARISICIATFRSWLEQRRPAPLTSF